MACWGADAIQKLAMGIAVEHAEKPARELAAKKFLTELGLGSGLGYREDWGYSWKWAGAPVNLAFQKPAVGLPLMPWGACSAECPAHDQVLQEQEAEVTGIR